MIILININVKISLIFSSAFNQITPGNVAGFLYYPSPPWICKTLGQATCVIIGEEESWECFRNFCAEKTLLEKIKKIDKDKFTYGDFKLLQFYFEDREFNEANSRKNSSTCLSFYNW